MTRNITLSSGADRLQRSALIIGLIGTIVAIVMGFFGAKTFFQSYLFAYFFWLGLSLGCFLLLATQHLAGGSWGAMIRRPLEAGAMLMPLMAILFIPVLFGMGSLYEWTHGEFLEAHPLVAAKVAYLNVPFFIARAALYFAIWIWITFRFLRLGKQQDESSAQSVHLALKMRGFGAPAMVLYVLTMTFAAFDWGMSLTPEWFSGMYGPILMIGQAISAMAFIICVMVLLANQYKPVDELLTTKRLQDLGNYLMAFAIFWAYVSVSQLIIIWSNNVVETNPYYVLRFNDTWRWVATFVLIFHFFVPFAILLSRWVKRKRNALVGVAIWMILMRFVDLFLIVVPAYGREGFPLHILDIALVVGMGGLWLAAYVWQLKARPLLPLHDPRLPSGDEHHG